MKKTLLVIFIVLCSVGFAQQQKQITRTHYYYSVLNVENEQILQHVVDEIGALKGIENCKYRLKLEKKSAEITFILEEKPKHAEGDKDFDIISIKKMIIDNGLNYNGYTSQSEKITE
ncbi:MAG: hypothetical protein ABI388_06495 [Bacteroidia bacterium]